MAGKIFVNYRRGDVRDAAARLRDNLAMTLGKDEVFMDVDNLLAGERFDLKLKEALAGTEIFLAVIGPRWLELLEARMDPVIAEVAAVRSLAASETKGKVRAVVDRLDLLLNDMGAVRFEAQRLDYFDPLIHQVIAERHDLNAPDHVILETVIPGYHTGRGQVIAKAGVTINRRA